MDRDSQTTIEAAVDEIMHEVEGYHAFEQRQGRALRAGTLTAAHARAEREEELAAIRQRVRRLVEQAGSTPGAS